MTLTAAFVAFVNAILVVITQFGANVSERQQASITALVNAGLVLGALAYDQRRGISKTKLPTPDAPTP